LPAEVPALIPHGGPDLDGAGNRGEAVDDRGIEGGFVTGRGAWERFERAVDAAGQEWAEAQTDNDARQI